MDIELFMAMLEIDSTSGKEAGFADFLAAELAGACRKIESFDVGDGTKNILVSWGEPKVVFCSHLDTVPPYISPSFTASAGAAGPVISGRGSCDAKGQIFAMYEACKALEAAGKSDFALLLLSGEETGSHGAKAFDAVMSSEAEGRVETSSWLIIGEPTDNCMVSAAKGTKSFEVTFTGRACHSGYPQYGISAVECFNDFMNALRSIRFPVDEELGETTWNIGMLESCNPQNVLSGSLTCRVYFRTTFESDEMVCNIMKNMAGPDAKLRFGRPKAQDGSDMVGKDVAEWQKRMTVKAFGGDTPMRYTTFDGFPVKSVAFGSDAPQLTCFKNKILCGPGSILVAHRDEEHIVYEDLETAVENYIRLYDIINEI
ncbi:MAG: M20/M25/M40 family metallo-hydrolase [Bacteroidales bacterium]|nr:M20/M25/M40 family metallo-hydrolase [Bacteroidales bacterium]